METFQLHLSDRKYERYKAIITKFNKNGVLIKKKVIHFGTKNGKTYIDHNDEQKKINYIKRHGALNEDWNDIYTKGALRRWILWNKPTLEESVKDVLEKFNLVYKI